MKTKHLIFTMLIYVLLFQGPFLPQLENDPTSKTKQISTLTLKEPQAGNDSDYVYFWEEMQNLPGNLPGDDILHYGSSFGPFHNYSEITEKLTQANQTFPGYMDLFSIGKTYYGNDIWCAKLTNELELTESPDDREKTRDWLTSDRIAIVSNRSIWASHPFKLINLKLAASTSEL